MFRYPHNRFGPAAELCRKKKPINLQSHISMTSQNSQKQQLKTNWRNNEISISTQHTDTIHRLLLVKWQIYVLPHVKTTPTKLIKIYYTQLLTNNITNHTHTQPFYGSLDSVRDNPGEPVPEETLTPIMVNSRHSSPICFRNIFPWRSFPHGIFPV